MNAERGVRNNETHNLGGGEIRLWSESYPHSELVPRPHSGPVTELIRYEVVLRRVSGVWTHVECARLSQQSNDAVESLDADGGGTGAG